MNDDEAFIGADIPAYDLAEINHRVEILRDIVIRPVFEVQVNDIPFFILLQLSSIRCVPSVCKLFSQMWHIFAH